MFELVFSVVKVCKHALILLTGFQLPLLTCTAPSSVTCFLTSETGSNHPLATS